VPIIVTFDIQRPTSLELNRIRSLFERLGWERLGNTAYRYPRLDAQQDMEDWFNHVLPALMLLRAFARHAATTGRNIANFSIDVQGSTGFDPEANVGLPPLPATETTYSQLPRTMRAFGQQRLQDWIDGIVWPYAPPPAGPGET
jgi:hypothetical protein